MVDAAASTGDTKGLYFATRVPVGSTKSLRA